MLENFQFNKLGWSSDVEERFWSKVKFPENPDDCWEWTAYKDKDGYGKFSINGEMFSAHVLSYGYYYGSIKDRRLLTLHTCDNRGCVNPNHLFLGTNADNVRDMVNKNRQAKGSQHGSAILTEEDVDEILAGIEFGKCKSVSDICQVYSTEYNTINGILRGKNWRYHTSKKYTDQQLLQLKNKIRIGTGPKLDETQVKQIKIMLQQNIPARVIASQFGVVTNTIYDIRSSKYWSQVK